MDGSGSARGGEVVGAVMVVGGGIAGMQASLDLANAGYKVYLVETQSAIGGHMAQLDKTFPTNDCAMCTISPRLVEVARHLNIEILTESEVSALDGEAGDFVASVRTRPRFIDPDICNGCGDCAKVCPVAVSNGFNLGLDGRRAAYKLYPQATPDAYAIDKRGIAPCRDACPAGQRAQGYIALIREGRYRDALRSIKADNPFPAICGRVCHRPCETACSRGKVDEPVNIRGLKRFVTDTVYAQPRTPPARAERRHDEQIAIIGAGPCGLTAAQSLCLRGYGVTVFEALPVAGGMLRVGVPEYRLPTAVIEREVQDILDLGVELRLGTRVTDLDGLFAQGFDAVLIATGAHRGVRLNLPGNDLDGVLVNTDFLRDARLVGVDPAVEDPRPTVENKRVLVLGGGDVAIDVARTALRLGAAEVGMACLEERPAMPAQEQEIAEALDEGIRIHNARTFDRILGDGAGRVAGVACRRVRRFGFDAGGGLSVEAEPGSEHTLAAEIVIFSTGQKTDLPFDPGAGVTVTERGTVAATPDGCATSRPGVFAAGDSVTGTAFAIDAVAQGHACAEAIERYLRGEQVVAEPPPPPVRADLAQADLDARVLRGQITPAKRVPMPVAPALSRVAGFAEVETGYTAEQARAEAARCLDCGICSECLSCVEACGVGAIDLDMAERVRELKVGAVVLAPGFQVYRAEFSEEYGLGRFDNVVTSLQYERLLSASGPTAGQVRRPSDGRPPRSIAFLQCVGSRDQSHDYCSSVCCMYAAKQAFMTLEHEPDTEVHVFMMDMRAFSKNFEPYYRKVREKRNVRYTRCRISAVKEAPASQNLVVRYADTTAADGMAIREEEFDMVVLSVGMEISDSVRGLGRRLGVQLDDHGFCHTVQFDPLQTSRDGIYAAGPFREPRDITESIIEASGAAAAAGGFLTRARGTLARAPDYPEERDVAGEDARIAVFVCRCGSNIGGYLDVPEVTQYADRLPGVIHAEESLYACAQDSIAHITERVKELGANRVVVASCTPLTHGPLFESSIRSAGLNPHLFDMANIRNQCSWVHSNDWNAATTKAKDLVRMSVARTAELAPLSTSEMPMNKAALVIGGGAAGMTVALALAEQGFPVTLVEQADTLGGNLRHVHFGLDDLGAGSRLPRNGSDRLSPQAFLCELIERVEASPLITVHLRSTLAATKGFMGNFTSTIARGDGDRFEVPHGVSVLCTGGVEYRGDEYGYGTSPSIVTGQEFESLLARHAAGHDGADCPPLPDSAAVILCVGPAETYCGRICCTTALKNALALKRLKPDARVTVLYRDIRTYGFKERVYTAAREAGVIFIRYDDAHRPQVRVSDGRPEIQAWETILEREIVLRPDMLVLSNPIVPSPATQELSDKLKIQLDANGFFLEAHVKLRPVDFASEGIFMAGLGHYPKLLEESIVQAQAAAARAAALLSHDTITTDGKVAMVDQSLCVGCLTCVRTCPYGAPHIEADRAGVAGILGAAKVEGALCQGCGLCAAACPAGAIDLMHYTDAQVMSKVDALFDPVFRKEATAP